MAYNLPPAWDPGYVLPENVQDEGLERRAFITKWQPRGSYDNPRVGTGGYAVPRYVEDEGYGQGTFTTKWQPSGTYNGPAVPHWLNQRPKVVKEQRLPGGGKLVTVEALGDTPMPRPFENYGQQAAQALIGRVSGLPPGQRVAAMRKIMNTIDTSLWSRTQSIMSRYVRQGMSPPQAFAQALSRALSTGIAAELIDTGLRRSAPQAKSLLGLGCYGHEALGATPSTGTVCDEDCQFRKRYHKPPAAPVGGAKINVGGLEFDVAGLTRTWAAASPPSAAIANRAAPPDIVITDPKAIPPEFAKFLHDLLVENITNNDDIASFASTNAMYGFPEWDGSPWFAALGVTGDMPQRKHILWRLRQAQSPLAKSKHPSGQDMVLHVQLAKADITKEADVNTNPLVLKAWLSLVPDPGFWGALWNTLITLPPRIATAVVTPIAKPIVDAAADAGNKIGQVVGAGLKDLGNLACDLLSTPGVGAAAGAIGGTVAGVPPQAGAAAGQAGAQIAQGSCGKAPPTPPPVPQTSILPLALLAGGAVLAVGLFARKKAP